MKRKILFCVLLSIICLAAKSQSGTNSPYSQYGLGILSDQALGYSRGMGGLSLGLRGSSMANMLNPASYSAADSLTMIFDLGLSGQITNFEENGTKVNANNADFEYAVALFRIMPKMGLSAGVMPYTNIGYSYSQTERIGTELTTTKVNKGSGGVHQAYVGLGWNFYKGLSLGANLSYLWGTYDRSISTTNNDAYINTMLKTYSATINSYKLDLGLQWQFDLKNKDQIVLGMTYGHGHKLGADPMVKTTYTNSQTGVTQDTTFTANNSLSIPESYGMGFVWKRTGKFMLGVDYTLQKWGDCEYPDVNSTTGVYEKRSGLLCDRSKVIVGGEWIPNAYTGKFLERIHYRMGVSYATPYIKVNGQDGPKEYSVSMGFGIPMIKSRSMFNLSAQWVHSSAKDLITENMFRINVGLTFSEGWFMKWKVQ